MKMHRNGWADQESKLMDVVTTKETEGSRNNS